MTPEEFRRHGHDVVDWVADYMTHIRDYPVLAQVEPGALTDQLPRAAPEQGESMDAILADFRELIVPAVTHWNHPGFHAFFSISGSPPGILGEMLTAALNVNGMLWKSCPALTELEQVTLSWLRQWLGLPDEFFGIIYDTASTSTLHAIAAARAGRDPNTLTLYCSDQAHSSVDKGALTVGIPHANIRKVASDDRFRMRPEALAQAMDEDAARGLIPFCVVATIGTTPTAAVDPVPEIAPITARHNAWLHVDAAYGGAVAISPNLRHLTAGMELGDSVVMNPHKWLMTPVDLSAFYTRRPEALKQAFSLVPAYLQTAENPRAVNLMDYGMQLGRRFRALKLWFAMRAYGRHGCAAVVERHCALAQELVTWIGQDARFEVCAPVDFSLVCLRLRASDDANRALLDRVNASGVAFLSPTVLRERVVLRLAIGNYQTTRDDLLRVWSTLRDLA